MNPSSLNSITSDDHYKGLHRLACASFIETSTLASLLFIAAPLKHMAGFPAAVSWIGPIHGMAFVVYLWLLSTWITNPIFTRREIARLLLSAFVPFGGFFNIGLFRRKKAALGLRHSQ
ncbi:DUF3817 domain-containing protein [Pseudomonas prosekii]|uniref:DUF3817 domain-containing protein n=1 Tax=Pseudomonas prosekii TaxID=1148509 RepID=UPI001CA3F3A7|nr:DUF3817 domain-containing protein [Pseudomonas prosekii]